MVRGGCGVRMLDARTAELKRVYIDPDARGLGLAPRLMESVLLAARRMGAERVVLETHAPTMGKALSIYRRYGFRERLPYSDIGRLDGAVTMQLEIGSHREVA
jgi:ribosomal protein S18 acetylase RimI-like enzyme